MKITDVRLRKVNNQDNRMKALVSITFDDAFVIHDLRVIEGNNGLFVAMPSKRTPDGEFRDIAHPIHSDMRQHVQEEVMRVYEESEAEVNDSDDSATETTESPVDPTEEQVTNAENPDAEDDEDK
ncbi:septation regulator SpoVG [Salinicoccus carnicancri]|uniref:septation regulator SpoVG n=1 Tax=Salinicoccus carnicancri TaxID=558170 RepID=UPI000302D0CF|nr:septation regulator SpoVG [Salinicoccus carnicancri]